MPRTRNPSRPRRGGGKRSKGAAAAAAAPDPPAMSTRSRSSRSNAVSDREAVAAPVSLGAGAGAVDGVPIAPMATPLPLTPCAPVAPIDPIDDGWLDWWSPEDSLRPATPAETSIKAPAEAPAKAPTETPNAPYHSGNNEDVWDSINSDRWYQLALRLKHTHSTSEGKLKKTLWTRMSYFFKEKWNVIRTSKQCSNRCSYLRGRWKDR